MKVTYLMPSGFVASFPCFITNVTKPVEVTRRPPAVKRRKRILPATFAPRCSRGIAKLSPQGVRPATLSRACNGLGSSVWFSSARGVSSSSVADGTASTVSGVLRTATVVAIAIALDGDVAGEGSSMHFAVSGVSWVTTTPAAEVIWMCSAYVGSVVVSPRRREYTNKLDAGCGLHKPVGEMSLCRSGRFEWRGTDAFPWTEFSQGASRGRAPASLVAMLSAWSSPVQTVPSFA
jgi:hypothetical protein